MLSCESLSPRFEPLLLFVSFLSLPLSNGSRISSLVRYAELLYFFCRCKRFPLSSPFFIDAPIRRTFSLYPEGVPIVVLYLVIDSIVIFYVWYS